jgi:hypothetical protein
MDASRFDRWTRRLAGRTTRRAAVGTALAGLGFAGVERLAASQATPAPAATPDPDTGVQPTFLFVQTAASGRGEVNPAAGTPAVEATPTPGSGASLLLTLEGHPGQTIYFSDRPERVVGATPTETFLAGFNFSPGNPPNAALVAAFEAGQGVVVLELIAPTYEAGTGTLTYGAEVLEGYGGDNLTPVLAEQVAERLPAEFGPAALFIDDCPNLTSCWDTNTLGAVPEGVVGDGGGRKVLGPIPSGSIPSRYNLWYGRCNVTDGNWNTAMSSCRSAYPNVGSGLWLGTSSEPWPWLE